MKKPLLFSALIIGVILGAYAFSFHNALTSMNIQEPYGFTGHVSVLVEKHSGTYFYETHNIVVTIGKTRMRDFLAWDNASAGATKYMSLSNDGSPLATWTKLPNEITTNGLDRNTGAVTYVNSTAYQVSYKWIATGSVTCQTGGLHHVVTDDSDNNLWAAVDFTQTSLSADENITLTWIVNHN